MSTRPFRQFVRANPLFSLLLVLFVLSGALLPAVDYPLTLWFQDRADPAFTELMGRSLFEGDLPGGGDLTVIAMLLVLGGYLFVAWRPDLRRLRRWLPELGFAVFGAIVSAVCLVHGLKWGVGRARPGEVLYGGLAYSDWYQFGAHFIDEGTYRGSFPSGHTLAAFLLMLGAYMLAGDPRASRAARRAGLGVGGLAIAYAAAMAVARMMSLSHWLSDCLLGLLLGWLLMHACYYWILRVPEQQLRRELGAERRDAPALFELRLGLLVIGLTAGAACALLGLRGLLLLGLHPLALLLPAGLLAGRFFLRLARRRHRHFWQRLSPPEEQP